MKKSILPFIFLCSLFCQTHASVSKKMLKPEVWKERGKIIAIVYEKKKAEKVWYSLEDKEIRRFHHYNSTVKIHPKNQQKKEEPACIATGTKFLMTEKKIKKVYTIDQDGFITNNVPDDAYALLKGLIEDFKNRKKNF